MDGGPILQPQEQPSTLRRCPPRLARSAHAPYPCGLAGSREHRDLCAPVVDFGTHPTQRRMPRAATVPSRCSCRGRRRNFHPVRSLAPLLDASPRDAAGARCARRLCRGKSSPHLQPPSDGRHRLAQRAVPPARACMRRRQVLHAMLRERLHDQCLVALESAPRNLRNQGPNPGATRMQCPPRTPRTRHRHDAPATEQAREALQ